MLDALSAKIDLYMRNYILPIFDPSHLHWVFSLSGGKDSYAMCRGILDWYQKHQCPIKATGLYIWQWGENPQEHFRQTLPQLRHICIKDARIFTPKLFSHPTQAPCRRCSDIRRNISDSFLSELGREEPILLCRGLHLTDIAISLLWRLAWYGPKPYLDGKGSALTPLPQKNCFLGKPLCLVREYECQEYAREQKYIPFCCDCPSKHFPSRRDIVEESLRHYYTGRLWEFNIPGCIDYLQTILKIPDVSMLTSLSQEGEETKTDCIPAEYYTFAKDNFLHRAPIRIFDRGVISLETQIPKLLDLGQYGEIVQNSWTCRLYSQPDSLTDFDLRMIGTLGPFWAAIALPRIQRNQILKEQAEVWNFYLNENWSQVCDFLSEYYQSI